MKLNVAILLSVVIHLGLIALLVSNFQFSKMEVKQSGTPQPKINAKAINSKRVDQLVSQLKKERLDKQRKEKQRFEQLKSAEKKATKKRKEEERKTENARKKRKQAEEQRKLEERKTADLKKKRITDEKRRKKKLEAEKKRQADITRQRKADAERKKKEAAERKRKAKQEAAEKARQEALEKEMQAQMDAEAAELATAHRQQVMNEVDKYVALITGKIYRNWIEPEQTGFCQFKLKVSPGGLVIGVVVVDGNPQHCESGQRAIYKSEPLPVSKDPDVFAELKSINLTLGEKK